MKSTLENSVIFEKNAVEISILDRWGKAIWKMKRTLASEPIRWNGVDLFGDRVSAGSYMSRIVYADHLVVYVPFVFLQK